MSRLPLRAAHLLGALLAVGAAAVCSAEQPAGPITPAELAARIESGSAPTVLDVRTPGEYAAGHVPGAVNIPHDALAERLAELDLPKSSEIVVHCESGRRASQAELVLVEAGFTRVRDLDGHMAAWREGGYPVE